MLDVIKLGNALPSVVGKAIERVFLVPVGPNQHQVYFVFTDGTYYEMYGSGSLSGGRCVDSGALTSVREICVRNSPHAVEVGPWGAGTPHILSAYQGGRRMLVEANGGRGGLSIVSLLPEAPAGLWATVSQVIERSPSAVRMLSDVACELLLGNGDAFGNTPRLVLQGFLGSGGEDIPPETLVPGIALWARAPWQRASAIRTFEQTVEDWREAGFLLPSQLGDLVPHPEDALRAFVPDGEVKSPEWVEEFTAAARKILNGGAAPRRRAADPSFRGAITGRELNRRYALGAAHALYHKDGTWYERLTRFPGVLCDPNGFVRYESEGAFMEDPRLRIGEKVNVQGAIADHPRYRRFETD